MTIQELLAFHPVVLTVEALAVTFTSPTRPPTVRTRELPVPVTRIDSRQVQSSELQLYDTGQWPVGHNCPSSAPKGNCNHDCYLDMTAVRYTS